MGHVDTQEAGKGLYDADFYSWTQKQAQNLRASRPNSVDWEHVAQEIEDLGRSQVNVVLSQIRNMLLHILKAYSLPDSDAGNHWLGEIVGFRGDAIQAYERSMRRVVEPQLAKTYERALRQAEAAFKASSLPSQCPFTLDELLEETTPPTVYVEKLSANKQPDVSG